MIVSNDIVIRKFQAKDREAVRIINCQTALMGKPSSIFFEGDEIFADASTLYFTDYEPQSCFVADYNGKVVGYLIGARNADVLKKISNTKIFPRLLFKAFGQGIFIKKKNIIIISRILLSMIKGEFNEPDLSGEYPAILHINIQEGYRDFEAGARLISAYLGYLTEENVRGIHLATMSERSSNFFSKQGFELLYRTRRSYLRHILHSDITVYIYGKKIPPKPPL